MAGNKDKIQTDTEDVAQFLPRPSPPKKSLCFMRGEWHLESEFCTCFLALSASLLVLVQHQLGASPSFTPQKTLGRDMHGTWELHIKRTLLNTTGWKLLTPVTSRHPPLFLYWMADVHTWFPQKTKKCHNNTDAHWIATWPKVTANQQRNPLLMSSELHALRFPSPSWSSPINYSPFHSPSKLEINISHEDGFVLRCRYIPSVRAYQQIFSARR